MAGVLVNKNEFFDDIDFSGLSGYLNFDSDECHVELDEECSIVTAINQAIDQVRKSVVWTGVCRQAKQLPLSERKVPFLLHTGPEWRWLLFMKQSPAGSIICYSESACRRLIEETTTFVPFGQLQQLLAVFGAGRAVGFTVSRAMDAVGCVFDQFEAGDRRAIVELCFRLTPDWDPFSQFLRLRTLQVPEAVPSPLRRSQFVANVIVNADQWLSASQPVPVASLVCGLWPFVQGCGAHLNRVLLVATAVSNRDACVFYDVNTGSFCRWTAAPANFLDKCDFCFNTGSDAGRGDDGVLLPSASGVVFNCFMGVVCGVNSCVPVSAAKLARITALVRRRFSPSTFCSIELESKSLWACDKELTCIRRAEYPLSPLCMDWNPWWWYTRDDDGCRRLNYGPLAGALGLSDPALDSFSIPLHSADHWLQQQRPPLLFEHRYAGAKQVQDRVFSVRSLVQGAVDAGFHRRLPVCVVASPGRHRVFMGHTDFNGLGGFTVNANTENELLCCAQREDAGDGACTPVLAQFDVDCCSSLSTVSCDDNGEAGAEQPAFLLTNGEPDLFPAATFTLSSLVAVCDDETNWGKENWSPNRWDSYVRGTLAYMLSARCPASARLRAQMTACRSLVRIHVARPGALSLQSSGGVSSSAALTGSVALAMRRLFHLNDECLPLPEIAEVDQGEWLLGKFAGSADKTAQLYGRRGKVTVVGSHPVRFLGDISFPSRLCVFMSECTVPRLSTMDGHRYLERLVQSTPAATSMTSDQQRVWITRVRRWAVSTMRRNSSHAFVLAVSLLKQRLEETVAGGGGRAPEGTGDRELAVSLDEARLVLSCLNTDGLLRDLCTGGRLDAHVRGQARWQLVYRLLLLLPESFVDQSLSTLPYAVRKAALYGLSEIERGVEYCETLRSSAVATVDDVDSVIEKILHLVGRAHDGDRAVIDYRLLDCGPAAATADVGDDGLGDDPGAHAGPMAWTAWSHSPESGASTAYIRQLLRDRVPLWDVPGGFERSLPEIDECADSLRSQFAGQAAIRVSAAGLGGAVAVYAHVNAASSVRQWLELKGWKVNVVVPGPPTQILF